MKATFESYCNYKVDDSKKTFHNINLRKLLFPGKQIRTNIYSIACALLSKSQTDELQAVDCKSMLIIRNLLRLSGSL